MKRTLTIVAALLATAALTYSLFAFAVPTFKEHQKLAKARAEYAAAARGETRTVQTTPPDGVFTGQYLRWAGATSNSQIQVTVMSIDASAVNQDNSAATDSRVATN